MDASNFLLYLALFMFFAHARAGAADGSISTTEKQQVKGTLGAIVNYSSRMGKEQKVAMEMAVEDMYNKRGIRFALHINNSQSDPLLAALAARNLIDEQKVQIILGHQTWEEASLVAEIGSQDDIPILSLGNPYSDWATERWPFLVQASPDKSTQMKAIAAIIQSWNWHQVTVIYEDSSAFATQVISHLSDALKEVNAVIIKSVALPPVTSSSLSTELEKLKHGHCRVFVVHLPFELTVELFRRAKEMKMMEEDYVWITTDPFTSLAHSINASTSSSMLGVLGVRSYIHEKEPGIPDFKARFRREFSLKHPEEDSHGPSIYAVEAYDVVQAACLAMSDGNLGGHNLLHRIQQTHFNGLSGKVQFIGRKLAPTNVFQIINIIGTGYREIGFWSDKLGFSETINGTGYSSSMKKLGQLIWPGGPWKNPRGWVLPTNATPLKIGVPSMATFKQFVNVRHDNITNDTTFEGFTIDLFKAIVEKMPYPLPYIFTEYQGSYDNVVKEVESKKFDAVVGDVAIVERRYKHADFTHPYTVPELVMISVERAENSNKTWLFLKPFTQTMWALIFSISLYNGFAVWLIERNHCSERTDSAVNQIGILVYISFSTLFSLHGEKLHSNLSRMVMVVWLFVALVITTTYTANLTSILTLQKIEASVSDIESLKKNEEKVGFCNGTFVEYYLVETLQFKRSNIQIYDSPADYAQALRRGDIAAAFLEAPYAKLFFAKYCKGFRTAGPSFKIGGFGFVLSKGSPLVRDVNKALLNVTESGKLKEFEDRMIAAEQCVERDPVEKVYSLGPDSFFVLLVSTGGTSSLALLVYSIRLKWKYWDTMFEHKTVWALMLAVIKYWGHQKRRFSRRVSDSEAFENHSNPSIHV